MKPLRNIAVIAYDKGLLSSLVFSLEVAGYHVLASQEWPEDGFVPGGLHCVVVDAVAYGRDPALRNGLDTLDVPLIYLADDIMLLPVLPRMSPLLKPFQGPELLQLVDMHVSGTAVPASAMN